MHLVIVGPSTKLIVPAGAIQRCSVSRNDGIDTVEPGDLDWSINVYKLVISGFVASFGTEHPTKK
jgi:hypothetical protein